MFKLVWRLPYLSTVSSQGNNQLITVMKKENGPELIDSQSYKNLPQLSHGGPI